MTVTRKAADENFAEGYESLIRAIEAMARRRSERGLEVAIQTQDLTAETMARLIKDHRNTITTYPGRLINLGRTIVWRLIIDLYREKQGRSGGPPRSTARLDEPLMDRDIMLAVGGDPTGQPDANLMMDKVKEALDRFLDGDGMARRYPLARRERMVGALVLQVLEGLSGEEVGEMIGLKKAMVNTDLQYIRRYLRVALRQRPGDRHEG